jgi:hypothetical protein
MMDEIIKIIHENMRKSINTMGLKTMIFELTTDYINTFHHVLQYLNLEHAQ